MELAHFLTHSGLTHLAVSLMVFPGFFCLLACSFLVFYYRIFCLYVANSFFCVPVFCPKLGFCLVLLQSVQVHPAVFLMHFVSAAFTLLASLALMVQFSLPYNTAGRSSVLYFYSCFLWSKHTFNNACYFQMLVQYVINIHFFFISYRSSQVLKGIYLFDNFDLYYNFTSNWILSI